MSQMEVRRITHEYTTGDERITALRDVSFSVGASEFVCVLGQSGCGKTTLLNLLAGFLTPTQGEILIGGKAVTGKGLDRGIVFQDFAQLFPWRTARRNVEFGLEIRNVPAEERREIALRYLRLVGLERFAAAFPHQLSGGMQQRVALCRALVVEPSLLLMDEPFGSLDALTRQKMGLELLKVWEEWKSTVVFVTHDIDEAVTLADRVLVMSPRPGRILEDVMVDLPRPRTVFLKDTPEFTRLSSRIRRRLWEEAPDA